WRGTPERPMPAAALRTAFLSRPLFWAFLCAAAGAALGEALELGPIVWLALAVAALLAGLAFRGANRRGGIAVAVAFLLVTPALAGWAARVASTATPGDVSGWCGRHVIVRGAVISDPEQMGTPPEVRWRFILQCEELQAASGTGPVSGRLAVTA